MKKTNLGFGIGTVIAVIVCLVVAVFMWAYAKYTDGEPILTTFYNAYFKKML